MMLKPEIIGFVCNWSLPTGVDVACPSEIKGYPKIHIIRVMCVGRIDPAMVLDAFAKGADGVLVIGCPSPDCHYVEGNLQAEKKIKMQKKLLALTGLEPDRLRIDWACATEAVVFATIINDFRNQVIKLGHSPLSGEKKDEKVLLNVLAAKNAAADFRLRVLTGREKELIEGMNVYGETTPQGEFDELLDEVVETEFFQQKIQLLTTQKPWSVTELTAIMDVQPTTVLRHIVDMRKKGVIVLDHVEKTTPFYRALEVT